MFTLLVSWLLVACVPGLLMVGTLGLCRLERELARDTVTATDVAEFLEQAEPVDVRTLAREGMPEALEYLHRRQALELAGSPSGGLHVGRHRPETIFARDLGRPNDGGLPTRIHAQSRINPHFDGTRYANRV